MVNMTKNSALGGLLEPIKNSAIWKSVLREAVLCEPRCKCKKTLEKTVPIPSDKFLPSH